MRTMADEGSAIGPTQPLHDSSDRLRARCWQLRPWRASLPRRRAPPPSSCCSCGLRPATQERGRFTMRQTVRQKRQKQARLASRLPPLRRRRTTRCCSTSCGATSLPRQAVWQPHSRNGDQLVFMLCSTVSASFPLPAGGGGGALPRAAAGAGPAARPGGVSGAVRQQGRAWQNVPVAIPTPRVWKVCYGLNAAVSVSVPPHLAASVCRAGRKRMPQRCGSWPHHTACGRPCCHQHCVPAFGPWEQPQPSRRGRCRQL